MHCSLLDSGVEDEALPESLEVGRGQDPVPGGVDGVAVAGLLLDVLQLPPGGVHLVDVVLPAQPEEIGRQHVEGCLDSLLLSRKFQGRR